MKAEPRLQIVGSNRLTLADELHLQLADDIVRGALVPGVALNETQLAERFQVSRSPVREAIRQLAASRLIEMHPHRSCVVARPDAGHLTEMLQAMAELEALCAGLAAERMIATERRALETLHERLRALMQVGDQQHYHKINEVFHTTIYRGAHNKCLVKIMVATRMRVQPFRRAQFHNLGELARSYADHDRVVTAIASGDRDGAAEAMYSHIMTVREKYGTAQDRAGA
jgi:DNA-binding GntR family transcriptional regulator